MGIRICNYELNAVDGLPIGGGYREFAIVEFGKEVARFVSHTDKAVRRMESVLKDAGLIICCPRTGRWVF